VRLDRKFVAEPERLAEEIVAVARGLLVRVSLVAAMLELRLPADALADLAQLGKRRGSDLIDLLVPEPVDAGMAQRVMALVAGTRTASELARGRKERDASARRFEIGGGARFRQMAARTGARGGHALEGAACV